MIYEFIDKILVHAPDRSSEERTQELDMKFIGKFDVPLPEPTPKELAEMEKVHQRRVYYREKARRAREKKKQQDKGVPPQAKRTMTTSQPYIGKMRKPGTGCISQISEHLWEGHYSPMWPDGKKHSRNVYAKTGEECEILLSGLIAKMKARSRPLSKAAPGNHSRQHQREEKDDCCLYAPTPGGHK